MTTTIGLEIDSRSMRLTAACGQGKRQKIRHGVVELPPGSVCDGVIQQVDTVADALTSWRKSMRIKGGQVVAVLSGVVVSSRIIILPPMNPEQIASALAWSDAVPLSGQPGLVRSHWNLGLGADKKNRVLAAAVREETAARLAEAVFLAGYELTALEIAPLSVWRLLKRGWLLPTPGKESTAGFAVLAIGEDGCDWMVFRQQQLWEWAHFNSYGQEGWDQNKGKYNFDPSGDGIENNQDSINDTDDESGELLSDGENDGPLWAGCQENNKRLINDHGIESIQQWLLETLMGYLSGQAKIHLSQLLLIGSRAAAPGLAAILQENISLPVIVGGPIDVAAALAAGASLRGEF